jgi:hypothetical protein
MNDELVEEQNRYEEQIEVLSNKLTAAVEDAKGWMAKYQQTKAVHEAAVSAERVRAEGFRRQAQDAQSRFLKEEARVDALLTVLAQLVRGEDDDD